MTRLTVFIGTQIGHASCHLADMTNRLIRKIAAVLAAAAALGGAGVAMSAGHAAPTTQALSVCVPLGHAKICPLNI